MLTKYTLFIAFLIWLLAGGVFAADLVRPEAKVASPGAQRAASGGLWLRLAPAAGGPIGISSADLHVYTDDELIGFNLLLRYEEGLSITTSASDYERDPAFFPDLRLGDNSLNFVRDAGSGRIRILGLAPIETTGPLAMGTLRLHIAPDAQIGATQVITLTGEVNLARSGVLPIEPVTATVHVISLDEHVYLPLIVR